MKNIYPVIINKSGDWYNAYIPDFENDTQGDSLLNAIEMARDAIGMLGITKEDMNTPIPSPSRIEDIKTKKGEIVTLVDIDFTEYRKKQDMKSIHKNVTLPSWLNETAIEHNINFSQLLQDAIKKQLNIV